MDVNGHLDMCGPQLIEGWLLWRGAPSELRLEVFIDGRLVGECVPDQFRQDLKDAGLGDGRCAFSFAIPSDVKARDFSSVRLRVAGTVLYLLADKQTSLPALHLTASARGMLLHAAG